ncbi:MerR family transcriptional regulator [Acidovorax sp. GBBC 3332]|nr:MULTISPECIES: MerR family transcriptional regulator [unclassified Acidovorax]MDA8448373.1 MerR family transcriptional regulator [Acidovorax sp. GBBC 3297]MDA8457660.1 MerR family transcriptional regulator [Acidovorax sp. GBBC 3333]MDA8462816.1 MerR family transcriptional regulator [Acidovorax sp. GBBC 3332]MDA8467730.1 MerR family transcriptional regulator [Acidovorax sp. GBBC 3299]
MWIAEFARRAGVKQTTVRHYLREGLLSPRAGPAGGSRPYLEFTESDLRLLSAIQAGQALGLSLQEIKLLIGERRSGSGQVRMLKALTAQRDRLRRRAQELRAMLTFLDRKIAWLEAGAKGPPPSHSAVHAAKR